MTLTMTASMRPVRRSLLFLVVCLWGVSSFTLLPQCKGTRTLSTQRFLSDQWDDEEELPSVTSYDEAASTLMKRKEEMDLMDQSDQGVPGVST
jgi:hypothetical protein